MPDIFVAGQLACAAFPDSATVLEDVNAIGNPQGRSCILFDNQDRRAILSDLLDGIENQPLEPRRDPDRGFVEQQELGPSHHRPPNRQHLLLAARQRTRLLLLALPKNWKQREHAIKIVLNLGLVERRYAPN